MVSGLAQSAVDRQCPSLDLAELLGKVGASGSEEVPRGAGFSRSRPQVAAEVLLDEFESSAARCAFLGFSDNAAHRVELRLSGCFQLETAAAGGWLLLPEEAGADAYWVPIPPMLRAFDGDGHILSYRQAEIAGVSVSTSSLSISLETLADRVLQLVVWRLPAAEPDLPQSLLTPSTLERQRYFLWSSHTAYTRPADVYLHLVHGHVYENHEVWPKYWRVCSELDAYALYVTLTGLLRATGKRLYALLRTQIVHSVMARQREDGGWYHGEWTDQMESHYRLHAGGMHLLAAYCEETDDPRARAALEKAADFAAERIDRLDIGAWYLHDSLETSAETLTRYPFRTHASRVLGKSTSNMLVLNTHLDTNIAMRRCALVTGAARHDDLIASASAATRAILALRPAEWLYRPLFKAIGLTFLPAEQARLLPLPLRAMKRLAWKYLVPLLPRIKARYPRLVMPGGFIERELSQYGMAVRYQPVNLMDLARTRRLFADAGLMPLLEASFAATRASGMTARWKEAKGKEDDSLGFWAEALYHLCLADPNPVYRDWLAEAMLDLEDNRLGLSPSLLGANAEAIAPGSQHLCPSPGHADLRVANLSRGDRREWLVVNPTRLPLPLRWQGEPAPALAWRAQDGTMPRVSDTPLIIAPRGWLHGT